MTFDRIFMTYHTTIERTKAIIGKYEILGDADVEIPIDVEYSYYKGSKGARDSLGGIPGAGPALEPDEPASIEIESVFDKNGCEIELTDKELEKIEQKIWDSHL